MQSPISRPTGSSEYHGVPLPEARRVSWNDLSRRSRIVGSCWHWILAFLGRTWRKRIVGHQTLDTMIERHERSVAAFWHGNYLTLLPLLAGRPGIVFTSASRRGDIIAAICLRAGLSVHEIPHSGKGHSYAIMRHVISRGGMAVIAVDGPLGPYHVVKTGAVRLASDLGCPIIPITCSAHPRKVRKGRWDRMQLPWFFARVMLVCGEPMRVPPGLCEAELGPWRAALRERLENLDRQADALLAARND